jgi:hypothetical protein
MKKFLIILTCVLGTLTLIPTADAGYRRTIVGYDSRGNPIIRVVWAADHLDYPRTIYDRRTYPTGLRRDQETLVPSYPSLTYTYPAYPVYVTPEPTNYQPYER